MKKSIGSIFFVLVFLTVLSSGCAPAPVATEVSAPTSVPPTSTPLPTLTPLPTSTLTPTSLPTNTPDPKVLTLKATSELLTLIDSWNGKYIIVVGKNTDIKTFENLNGTMILWDGLYDTQKATKDVDAFKVASGLQLGMLAYGNDIPQFLQIMSGNQNIVAFVSKANVDKYSLESNPNLKVIVFE